MWQRDFLCTLKLHKLQSIKQNQNLLSNIKKYIPREEMTNSFHQLRGTAIGLIGLKQNYLSTFWIFFTILLISFRKELKCLDVPRNISLNTEEFVKICPVMFFSIDETWQSFRTLFAYISYLTSRFSFHRNKFGAHISPICRNQF